MVEKAAEDRLRCDGADALDRAMKRDVLVQRSMSPHLIIYPDSLKSREKFLAFSNWADSVARMIQSGFRSEEDRKALAALARDGSSRCRVSRRANALVLLDKRRSCEQVAHALLLDDDTIRGWRKLFEQRGIEGITSFDVGGSASYLSMNQEDDLKAWVGAALPRSTRQIRRLDREGIRRRLRRPLGTDRAVASLGARISQTHVRLSPHTAPIRHTNRSYQVASARRDSLFPEPIFEESDSCGSCEL